MTDLWTHLRLSARVCACVSETELAGGLQTPGRRHLAGPATEINAYFKTRCQQLNLIYIFTYILVSWFKVKIVRGVVIQFIVVFGTVTDFDLTFNFLILSCLILLRR